MIEPTGKWCAQVLPRIALGLAQRQADAALDEVELGHDRVELLPDREDLRRVDHLLGPRHLADVDQALDALLELDEGAVVDQRHDLAVDARADRVLLVDQDPGILALLLVAERDALGLAVELEHHHLGLVADREVLGGVVDAAPGDVGDVQQAVDAAEVDEHAVVGDVLDHALHPRALLQLLEGLGLLLLVLLLEHGLARQHDVVAAAVEADDLELELLALERLEVLDRLDVGEAAGQEGAHADVDGQAALDAVDDAALDDAAFLEALLDVGPDPHPLGLRVREQHVPLDVLGALEQHLDLVADLDRELAFHVAELVDRDQTLRLVADVDHHRVVVDRDHLAADDLALGEVAQALVVERDELLVRLLVLGARRLREIRALLVSRNHKPDYLLDVMWLRLLPGFPVGGLVSRIARCARAASLGRNDTWRQAPGSARAGSRPGSRGPPRARRRALERRRAARRRAARAPRPPRPARPARGPRRAPRPAPAPRRGRPGCRAPAAALRRSPSGLARSSGLPRKTVARSPASPEAEEADQIERPALGRHLDLGPAGERQRAPVPGADLLADVAAERPVAEPRPALRRDRAAVLDRPVGDAAVGVEPAGRRQGAGRAGVEAARCTGRRGRRAAAPARGRASAAARRAGTRSRAPARAGWCSCRPLRARRAPRARARGSARCRRRRGCRCRGTPRRPRVRHPLEPLRASSGGSRRRARSAPPAARDRPASSSAPLDRRVAPGDAERAAGARQQLARIEPALDPPLEPGHAGVVAARQPAPEGAAGRRRRRAPRRRPRRSPRRAPGSRTRAAAARRSTLRF